MVTIKNTGFPTPLHDPTANKAIARAMRGSVPTESDEQISLFQWAERQDKVYPELRLMYHIPNGGLRNKVTAARLKAEGVKPGVPDIFLPAPRGRWHGLYIELKRRKGGKVSDEQAAWIYSLDKMGYKVAVCRGWTEASEVIVGYLNG